MAGYEAEHILANLEGWSFIFLHCKESETVSAKLYNMDNPWIELL